MPATHYERLSAQDITFLPQESEHTPMHISWVWIFDASPLTNEKGQLDVESIRKRIASTVSRVPRLRQVLAFIPIENDPVWVDDPGFDLDHHFMPVELAKPYDDAALQELAGELIAERLDRARPLWEMYLVEGLTENRFAIICKMHHAMVDGASFVYLMSLFFGEEPSDQIEPVLENEPRLIPDDWELMRDALTRRIEMPREISQEVKALFAELRTEREELKQDFDLNAALSATWNTMRAGLTLAPRTPLNESIDAERSVRWLHLDVEKALQVRRKLGGTVNDVVLATVAGAMHRYLNQHEEAVPPKGFRIVVPVNTRSPEEAETLGNQASGWVIGLPVEEGDPGERYQKVLEETSHFKETKQSLGATTLLQTAEWAGYNAIAMGVGVLGKLRPYNLIVSNHARIDGDRYLLQAKLLEGYPLNPLFGNQGMVISLASYRGQLMIATISNPPRVPDIDVFQDDLEESFAELVSFAQSA